MCHQELCKIAQSGHSDYRSRGSGPKTSNLPRRGETLIDDFKTFQTRKYLLV